MMQKTNFTFPTGAHTVLVTPFVKNTYEIDYDDLTQWFEYQSLLNIDGLVLLGSTSESATLSNVEKLAIVKHIHTLNLQKSLQKSSPKFITVGISGSNDIRETIEFAKECVGYCNAFMVTVPHYVKPPQRGIIEWFRQICCHPDLKSVPIIMYNIPGRTCVNMLPETMKTIYDMCPNVVAIKEASGSIEQMKEVIRLIPDIKLFSGDDGLIEDVIKIGGVGVISVVSNIIPYEITYLTKLCMEGNFEKANEIKKAVFMDELLTVLFCETNPIPVKHMLYRLKIYKSDEMRLPLVPLHKSKHAEVSNIMEKLYTNICLTKDETTNQMNVTFSI